MWHGILAQPGTTPPSSSTFGTFTKPARNATCSRRNLSAYRPLPGKIGADRVEWLESQTSPSRRMWLIRFAAVMGKRL
jgi:hypothetical protein